MSRPRRAGDNPEAGQESFEIRVRDRFGQLNSVKARAVFDSDSISSIVSRPFWHGVGACRLVKEARFPDQRLELSSSLWVDLRRVDDDRLAKCWNMNKSATHFESDPHFLVRLQYRPVKRLMYNVRPSVASDLTTSFRLLR